MFDSQASQALTITAQIDKGVLVCPVTRRPLCHAPDEKWLVADGSAYRYPLVGTVPILLSDRAAMSEYVAQSEAMNRDYSLSRKARRRSLKQLFAGDDYRTPGSRIAATTVFTSLPPDALCISPGGGPVRFHPRLVNVNIGPFENVDVVGDAHNLPYADNTVDAVHSEAVFEHLHDPSRAALELLRVMKPGAKAFVSTPFLQQHHGYPHHYQNYTLQGHRLLFERAGFVVLEAGHCVGPVVALTALVSAFLREYLPRPIDKMAWFVWGALAVVLRPIDRVLWKHKGAHILASSTYVLIQKPTVARCQSAT